MGGRSRIATRAPDALTERRRLAGMRAGIRSTAILGLSAALVVACSGGSSPSAPPGSASPASGVDPSSRVDPSAIAPSAIASSASPAASRSAEITVGGDRPVTVHVPPGYDPGRPAPLLILLHGFGSTGADQDAYFDLGRVAEQRGYLYAYPDGSPDGSGPCSGMRPTRAATSVGSGSTTPPTSPASSTRSRRHSPSIPSASM